MDNNEIGTICKSCIFATWSGKIQSGCYKDIYQKYNADLIHDRFDPESGLSYISIDGRICYHCRSQQWKDQHETKDLDELFDISRKECELKVELILLVKKENTLDDLEKTIKSIEKMPIKPANIFIVNCNAIKPSNILHWLNVNMSTPWHMEYIMDASVDVLDLIIPKLKTIYFMVGEAGKEFDANMLVKLDKMLYDDLRQIVMAEIEPGQLHGLFCMRYLYKNVGGNAGGKTAVEKIKILGEEQNCQTSIIKL